MKVTEENISRYELIANELQQSIESGIIKPGSPLSPIRMLTVEYGVSVNTVVRALNLLVQRDVVTRVSNRGYFVPGTEDVACDLRQIMFLSPWNQQVDTLFSRGMYNAIDLDHSSLSIHLHHGDPKKFQDLVNQVPRIRPDGVIVLSTPLHLIELDLSSIDEAGIPIVTLGGYGDDMMHDAVRNSRDSFMKVAVDRINRTDCKNLALFVTGPRWVNDYTIRSMRNQLRKVGRDIPEDRVFVLDLPHVFDENPDFYTDAYLNMKRMLADGFQCDMLVCDWDYLAVGVLRAILEAGIRVPEDMKVISTLMMPTNGASPMKLTTVDSNAEHQGYLAMEILQRRLNEGARDHTEVHYVPGTLIDGETA